MTAERGLGAPEWLAKRGAPPPANTKPHLASADLHPASDDLRRASAILHRANLDLHRASGNLHCDGAAPPFFHAGPPGHRDEPTSFLRDAPSGG
jgi:hypothetical protein